jgi:anti-anti-sigma factor
MQIERRQQGDFSILSVAGAVRLGESGRQVSDALRSELEDGAGHVLLEMSGIDYMDSTGIGELVGYLCRLSDVGRKLVLVSPSERVVKLLEVARLAGQFPIYPSVEEAITGES